MFREQYKAAIDSIPVNEELLNKLLKEKPKRYNYMRYISSAAAAVFVISGALYVLPKLNYKENDIIFEETIISDMSEDKNSKNKDEEPISAIAESEVLETKRPEKTPAHIKEPVKTEKPSARNVLPSVEPDIILPPRPTLKPVETEEYEIHEYSSYIPEVYYEEYETYVYDEDKSFTLSGGEEEPLVYKSYDTGKESYAENIVLSINSIMPQMQNSSPYNNYDIFGDYHYERWDFQKYTEYLGMDIKMPFGYSFVGDDETMIMVGENGETGLDTRVFPYENSRGGYVTVMTTKHTENIDLYLNDSAFSKSVVYGYEAVVFSGYECYLKCGDVGFIVHTDNIDENELKEILTSLFG